MIAGQGAVRTRQKIRTGGKQTVVVLPDRAVLTGILFVLRRGLPT
jgi:hypothetical protein